MPEFDVSHSTETVHWAIALVAKEGKEAELEAALVRLVQRSLASPGVMGVHLMKPAPGSNSREFRVHRAFQSLQHSHDFYESELFRQYQDETADLIDGSAVIRRLHGFEAFFRDGNFVPPKWKMALVTWLGVFPSIVVVSSTLGPFLTRLPSLVAMLITTVVMVITLAWVVMPLLTRLFRPWLNRRVEEVYFNAPLPTSPSTENPHEVEIVAQS